MEPWDIYSSVGKEGGLVAIVLKTYWLYPTAIYPPGFPPKSTKWFLIQRKELVTGVWEKDMLCRGWLKSI